jgi:uncharacterized RmlC-like cupin family protein
MKKLLPSDPKKPILHANTAGAKGLCMHLAIILPGGKATAHYHNGYETAIYIVKGNADTRYSPNLDYSSINEAGDFIFIPPNVLHQPVNLSETEEVVAGSLPVMIQMSRKVWSCSI